MGCGDSRQAPRDINQPKVKGIKVVNLYYGCSLQSPYQFYTHGNVQQLEQLSTIFKQTIHHYIPKSQLNQDFKWLCQDLEQSFRIGRYSPLYDFTVGIQNNQFISLDEFNKKWNDVFELKAKELKLNNTFQEQLRTYDIIMMHSLLKWVYKIDVFNQAQKFSCVPYLDRVVPLFEQSFMNQKKKIDKLLTYINKLKPDVMIFQEFSHQLHDQLSLIRDDKDNTKQKYYISGQFDQNRREKNTLIIAKKKTFKYAENKTNQFMFQMDNQIKDNLLASNNPAILVIGFYIIIGVQLSTQEYQNQPQIKKFEKALKQMQKAYPDYDIIIGGNFNDFFQPMTEHYLMYPRYKEEITKRLKRTYTQIKFQKSNREQALSTDKIITTLGAYKQEIRMINGKKAQENVLLPTQDHPFQHFAVWMELKKRNTKEEGEKEKKGEGEKEKKEERKKSKHKKKKKENQ